MQQGTVLQGKRRFERRRKGRWLWIAGGVAAGVGILSTACWFLVLPGLVSEKVGALKRSVERLVGVPVSYESVDLVGPNKIEVRGVVVGDATNPLVKVELLSVWIDPFSFEEGLPAVELVKMDGVKVSAVKGEGDNVSAVLSALAARLRGKGKEGVKRGKLAALLRQTPRISVADLSVTFDVDFGDGPVRVVDFRLGKAEAHNPNLSLRELGYQVDAEFGSCNGRSRADLELDFDFSTKRIDARVAFSPAVLLAWGGREVALEGVRYSSGRFVEVKLGRVVLGNPFGNLDRLQVILNELGAGGAIDEWRRWINLAKGWKRKGEEKARALVVRAARLGYPEAVWKSWVGDLKGMVAEIVERLLDEVGGDRVVLNGARFVSTTSGIGPGETIRNYRLYLNQGDRGGGEISVEHAVEAGERVVSFDLVSPSQLVQLSGKIERAGGRTTGDVQISVDLGDPLLKVKGEVHLDGATMNGRLKVQTRSTKPPLAVSGEMVLKEGRVTGELEGELFVPGVLSARKIRATFEEGKWVVDVGGALYPSSGGEVEFHGTVDSANGIRRASVSCATEVRIPMGEWDLVFSRARVGRDGIVHLEDVAVVAKGAGRDRAVLTTADLSLVLQSTGKELIDAVLDAGLEGRMEELLAELVSQVEIIEPVMKLRQPTRLQLVDRMAPVVSEEVSDKISDAFEEGSKEAVVMYEPYRKALSSVASGAGQMIRKLVQAALKGGDRFPIKEVVIREGRFEYADAVSPEDRLITDLSHFNATLTKTVRVGNLGGKFTAHADFVTSLGDWGSSSSLDAEVDLATGDLKGELKVEKITLYPYRFLFPGIIVPTGLSMIRDADIGFSYGSETDQFTVWGKGRICDFNVWSPAISARPIEHMTFDLELGQGPGRGLVFELDRKRVLTTTPIVIGFGKVKGLALELTLDASDSEFPKFKGSLALPDTAVNDLLASLPKGFTEELTGLKVAGLLGFRFSVTGDGRDLRGLTFTFDSTEQGVEIEAPGRKVDFNRLAGSFIHHPPTDPKRGILVGEGEGYVPLAKISPWLVLAVMTCEDGSFFQHVGFNTYQIKMSIVRNLEKGRFARGASTLTMQLVKNLFLNHDKTVARKIQEIILTWLVEKEIEKERLIELYLNVIEWGEGVYGIKEACDFYFGGVPPDSLSPAQAAFLASFIPYPRPFSIKFKKGMNKAERTKSWERWWEKRGKIVKRVIRAMVKNCDNIDSKCPWEVPYCRVLAATCKDPGRELIAADNIKNLDEIFQPHGVMGDKGMLEF